MNRGVTISGAVMVAVSVLIPLVFFATLGSGFEDVMGAFVFVIFIIPLLAIIGLIGLVMLIVGLATGNGGQQQQQQVVVTSEGYIYCPNGHATQPGIQYCTSCGVPLRA